MEASLGSLRAAQRWVAWQTEEREAGKPATKVPYSACGNGKARADDAATWGTRHAAEARAARLPKPFGLGGVGIELGDTGDGMSLGGIDLDSCRSDDGAFAPWAAQVMERFGSYAEVSPSGTGAKVFFRFPTADLPAIREAMGTLHSRLWQRRGDGAGHPPAIELHCGNRYFCVTDERLPDMPAELRVVGLDTLLWLIRQAGPGFSGNGHGPDDEGLFDAPDLLARIEAATARWPALAKRWRGDWTGLKDQSRSGKAMSLIAALKKSGFTREDAAAALALHPDTRAWAAEANPRDLDRAFGKSGTGTKQTGLGTGALVTEGSVAAAFTARHRETMRYCHHTGAWFRWDGAIWRKEETKLAYRFAHQAAHDLAQATGDGRVIVQAGKANFAAGVERIAQAGEAFAVTSKIWDCDPWLLGTPAGTVDLRAGVLHPAQQCDYITKATAVAPADAANCPRWLAFLEQATAGDGALIGFLKRWLGYCLTGDTREHALVFVYGSGGNGKGVLLNTMAGLLGGYATTAPMDTFTASQGERHPTDLAGLRGARLVMATETEEGRCWAEAKIKALTGGDPISARFMRQDFFTYLPEFKLMVSGNHKPTLRNVDDAARRRMNLAPFTNKPPVVDKELGAKLEPEWPAILRWLLDGCLEWQRDGLRQPEAVLRATAEYFDEQNTLAQWIEDCCEVGKGRSDTSASLFESWRNYAAAKGEEHRTAKWFSTALGRHSDSFMPVKDTDRFRGRGWRGIAVRVVSAWEHEA